MPLLWIIGALGTAAAGAFVGSQIDDRLDPVTPANDSHGQNVNWTKIFLYGGGALLLYTMARKNGLVK